MRLVAVTVLGVLAVQLFGFVDEPCHVFAGGGHAQRNDVAGRTERRTSTRFAPSRRARIPSNSFPDIAHHRSLARSACILGDLLDDSPVLALGAAKVICDDNRDDVAFCGHIGARSQSSVFLIGNTSLAAARRAAICCDSATNGFGITLRPRVWVVVFASS